MADIPNPRSYPSILGDLIDGFLSRYGLNKIKVGGPILSILEAAAQSDLRSTQDIFNLLNEMDLNRASLQGLQRIAADEDLRPRAATAASGKVTFSDSGFTKIATRIYAGSSGPNAGSLTIKIADGSVFPATGSVYLGRGTTNYEGPINYTSVVASGNYYTLTLSTPTQKFHNVNETVIVAQGGVRTIPAGTTIQTPQSAIAPAIIYSTLYPASIEDGETQIEGVTVVCQERGVSGNVPAGAISVVLSSPFTAAAVTNPSAFSNGLPAEESDELRERIKLARKSRSKGTRHAILSAVVGTTATDENKVVVSASLQAFEGRPLTLYIDDGNGYEEKTEGIASEIIVDEAIGGERYFKIIGGLPLTKAFVTTSTTTPFSLVSGAKLAVKVSGILTEHSFESSQFRAIGNATSYEIVSAINGNSELGFSARTADDGQRISIFARSDTNEDIEVVAPSSGIDANDYLGFSTGRHDTIRLYKNDELLYKDGLSAMLSSAPQTLWSNTITSGVQLRVSVDGTSAVNYTFSDVDFISANTGYTSVTSNNSLESWATVFNAKIPGITATVESGRLVLLSNIGSSDRASLVLSEPSPYSANNLIQKGMFTSAYGLSSVGRSSDYTLNRNTGEGALNAALSSGDKLTVGTSATRAYLQGDAITSTVVTLASGGSDVNRGGTLWIAVDGDAEILSTAVNSSIAFTTAHNSMSRVRYTAATTNIFGNSTDGAFIRAGDWVVIWSTNFNARGAWRISDVDTVNYQWFEVQRPQDPAIQSGITAANETMVFCRTSSQIQEIRLAPGVSRTLTSIINEINGQLVGASASVWNNVHVRLTTNTYGLGGDLMLVTADTEGQKLLLPDGELAVNTPAHLGSITSTKTEIGTPDVDPLAESIPTSRYSYASAVVGSKFYVIGGSTAVSSNEVYDPVTNTWTAKAAMPTARGWLGAAAVGTKIYVMGGYNGTSYLNTNEEYDTVANKWTTKSSTGFTARSGLSVVAVGTKIYALGGYDGSAKNTNEEYDTSLNSWSTKTVLPAAKYNFAAAAVSTEIFCMGGNTGSVVNTVAKYDTGSNTWTSPLTAMTGVRQGHAAAVVGTDIYVFGGSTALTGASIVNIVEKYSTTGNSWSSSYAAMPTPRRYFGVAYIGSKIYAVGGQLTDISISDVNEIYIPAYNLWPETGVVVANNYGPTYLPAANAATFDRWQYWLRRQDTAVNTWSQNVDTYWLPKSIDNNSYVQPRLYSQPSTYSIAIGSLVRAVNVVTATTGSPHGYRVGDVVHVGPTGTADANFAAGYKLVKAVASTTTFTYDESGTSIASTTAYATSKTLGVLTDDVYVNAATLAIGPEDSLGVVLDGDSVAKNFSVPAFRRIKPFSGAVYGPTAFGIVDVDNANADPDEAFGSSDSNIFRDFALYMKARGKSHGAASPSYSDNKTILWRYARMGPEGNAVRVAYVNPTAPSQTMALSTAVGQWVDVEIRLPSGSQITTTGISSTNLFTISAQSGYDITYTYSEKTVTSGNASRSGSTVTLTTTGNHGFSVGDSIYVNSADILFTSGYKTLVSPSSGTTLTYIESGTAGPSTSSITVRDTLTPPDFSALVAGTLVTLGSGSAFGAANQGTFRIISVTPTSFTVRRPGGSGAAQTTPVKLLDVANMVFYPLNVASNTATVVASWVNANASSVISATVVSNGAASPGTGLINKATVDEFLDGDANASTSTPSWSLSDGINWIETSNIQSTANPNTIALKMAVNAELTANADFANEEMRLVPITNETLTRWLESPANSGLYAGSQIEAADNSKRLQLTTTFIGAEGSIQVTGGNANATSAAVLGTGSNIYGGYSKVTVDGAQVQGFRAGQWVAVQAQDIAPKTTPWNDSSTLAIAVDGTVTITAPDACWTIRGSATALNDTGDKWRIWKIGSFALYSLEDDASPVNSVPASVVEGDWVDIVLSNASSANTGRKQVVRRVSPTKFWIENPDAVSEVITMASGDSLKFYSYDSVMPGDTFVIDTQAFGATNQGQFVVTAHGASSTQFKISGASQVSSTAMTGVSAFVRCMEASPTRLIKRIHTVGRNASNSSYVDMVFRQGKQSSLSTKMSEARGSTITALDKLVFDTDAVSGLDAYNYSTGLIAEVNRILYGVVDNEDVYPGVVAAGSNVNVSGPLVKRITVSLAIRIRAGVRGQDVVTAVRSAVAAAINRYDIGENIDISLLISEARSVANVVSVTWLAPDYQSGSDLIAVQADEKPLVLDANTDIMVSIIGD